MLAATVLGPQAHCAASTARDSRMHVHGCSTMRARCGTVRAIPLLSTSITCTSVEVRCMCNGPYTSMRTPHSRRMPNHGTAPDRDNKLSHLSSFQRAGIPANASAKERV